MDKKEAAATGTGMAIAGGAAAATGATGVGLLASGLAAGVAPVTKHFFDRKQRAAEKWWERLIRAETDSDTTPEEIAGLIEHQVGEPFVWETIHRSLRTLYDTPVEEATVPLAVLAREYLRDHKPPDAFFRGVCDLLTSVSRSEFAQLHGLAQQVVQRVGGHLRDVRVESGTLRDGLVKVSVVEGPQVNVEMADGPQLIRKLCQYDLAVEIGAMDKGLNARHAHCRLEKDVAVRLARLLLS